jgi:hypothetical protein
MAVVVTLTAMVVPFPDAGYVLVSLTVIVALPAPIAVTVNVVAPEAGDTVATEAFDVVAENVPV